MHIDPDNYPSVEAEPLGPQELQVKKHWQEFCPNLVKSLNDQGPEALDTAIRVAWWRTEYEVMMAMHLDPKLSLLHADSMFRNRWLFLPPETHTTPDIGRQIMD